MKSINNLGPCAGKNNVDILPIDLECTLASSFPRVVTKKGIYEDWRTGEAVWIVSPYHPLL